MVTDTLKSRITEAMKAAMKAHDKARLGTIRLILADLKRVEVDERIELDDNRVIVILDKMLKQRRDSIQQFEAASRNELAEIEKQEIRVIQEFLPTALTETELNRLIDDTINSTQATSIKDMGKVMSVLKPQLQGRADIGQVSAILKTKLGA